ncbi:uncharacterized protein LOC114312858 isoform X2 [Camellia sinensis]|uniref:uncharacterized protein LOC114312858 isoform X2 n=1 Tax=Camellia sinensis TaxID=4442 RepID=UPI001036BD5F|nr:uncharacterized protein LOC114312858 isoform X2 [Camellia sinensis]XP_028114953.1 uncharacterized protein LOC114312858 isoform X2 [Camellia sinensis]
MNIEIVFPLSNQSLPTCLTSLECPAFFPLVNRMMLLPLLLKEKGKGIMLVGQVVQAVLAATLVLLQVILIAIVPLLLDQMQGIHLELEWIQLSILMSFCCNIYTRHNPLQCLGLLMSILTLKVLHLLGVARMQLI